MQAGQALLPRKFLRLDRSGRTLAFGRAVFGLVGYVVRIEFGRLVDVFGACVEFGHGLFDARKRSPGAACQSAEAEISV